MIVTLAAFVAFLAGTSSAQTIAQNRTIINACLQKALVPYDNFTSTNWTSDSLPFNRRLPYTPAAIAVPTTIPQIQAAVNCGRTAGVKVTPKGGGHSYASFGIGGEDGHLVVQLDQMFNVTLNKATNVATIQPGARLGHVANQLWTQGQRAISAGTCPGVGVSGHSLHGGYGMSSHKYGLATDWIVSMKVVLANGTLVTASATQNSELFWALRGAGSNYGIVASYDFATFAAPAQVSYFNIPVTGWNVTNSPGYLMALETYVNKSMPAELTMRGFFSRGNSYLEGMYFGNVTALKTTLAPLFVTTNLKLGSSTNTTWLNTFSHYANAPTDPTFPYSTQETFYSKSLTLQRWTSDSVSAFTKFWFNTGPTNSRSWWFQLDFHGGPTSAVTNPSNLLPNPDHSQSSYAHRDSMYLIQFYDSVFFGDYPSTGYPFLDGFVGNTTKSLVDDAWGMYINYADNRLDPKAAKRAYYGSNLVRLRQAKSTYDPQEVFYYPQGVRVYEDGDI